MKRIILGILIALICMNFGVAQNLPDGHKRWSSENKLTIDDFKIKVGDENSDVISSRFQTSHELGEFDLFPKNLNQRIHNIFVGNVSWIDTTKIENLEVEMEFQQLQFDIFEIYTRKFRKEVLKNKKEIIKEYETIKQIYKEIMAGIDEEISRFLKETDNGKNIVKLQEWREKIASGLNELNEFRFENKMKIKITD